jgi:hypothetical protein
MSSFLKPELAADADPATPAATPAPAPATVGTPIPVIVTAPPAHVPTSADVGALVEAAHEHIERLVSTELSTIQSTLASAWRASEEALVQTRAELADLRRQHEALKLLNAENERKLAVLEDVKRKLAGL